MTLRPGSILSEGRVHGGVFSLSELLENPFPVVRYAVVSDLFAMVFKGTFTNVTTVYVGGTYFS